MLRAYLYINNTAQKGRGVFTKKKIPAGTLIEVAPVIVVPQQDRPHLDKTLLHDYIFEWGEEKDKCIVALGWISIYNHSYTSNCEYLMDFDDEVIFIKTVRDIGKDEELTINYNGDWDDAKPVWFDVK